MKRIFRVLKAVWELRHYPAFAYAKYWKYRNTIGPWMQWSLPAQTRKEILLNGWSDEPMIGVSHVASGPGTSEDEGCHSRTG